MARKIQVRLIMQLRAAGLSQSEIARTHHMSKTSVSEVFSIAQERQISYDALKEKSNEECYRLFFPDKHQEEQVYEKPDYEYVHRELSRTGVTLKLLWKEYRDHCLKQLRLMDAPLWESSSRSYFLFQRQLLLQSDLCMPLQYGTTIQQFRSTSQTVIRLTSSTF